MIDQISASTELAYEPGDGKLWVTCYNSHCGCSWTVDMWGNVRKVMVCRRCMAAPVLKEQLVFDLTRPAAP